MKNENDFLNGEQGSYKWGVYMHKTNASLALLRPPTEDEDWDWIVDKDKRKKHTFFNMSYNVVEGGTGFYFLHRSLKNYEYLGEQ